MKVTLLPLYASNIPLIDVAECALHLLTEPIDIHIYFQLRRHIHMCGTYDLFHVHNSAVK